LDTQSAVSRRAQRLWVFASTQQSTDNRSARNQERMGLVQAMAGQLGSAVAWVDPEIQALGSAKVEAAIAADPGLAKHAVRLRNTLRKASHTLSPETEATLAALSPVLNAAGQTRTLLVDADAEWPSITLAGKPVKVNSNGYETLRQHADRAVRKQAFDAFFGQLGKFENTFGSTLSTRVQAGTVQAKLRKHPTAVAASLDGYQMPEAVYRMLVAQANAGLPTLHRYFKLRQRMLNLPDLHYYDIYPPLVELGRSYSGDEAARLTLAATVPLGPEYQQLLASALAMRTMHLRPAEGKSGGAYQTGVYGLTPYVFLNHRDDWGSVSTFAHEWGHGVHTMLAQKNQPFETAGYSLFLAEIASITNEVLLGAHMMKGAATREERLFQLGHSLEELRGTFFRQTMFGEFELTVHDALERGEALSGKRMTGIYCGLLRKYHGADAGVMAIDPLYCQEWAFIPHFYRPFYVYQYATSAAAASYFGEQVLTGNVAARDNYLNVLRAGGSRPPYELLKAAGLDMATPAPYQAVLRRMNSIIDEMEQLLDNRG
ncbi:MAG: oligoendopeptidase F family protein, partial [Chitinophagaceae bacterium]|nr:oligoendopeptidase F family protein [Rubrivivax sp.]